MTKNTKTKTIKKTKKQEPKIVKVKDTETFKRFYKKSKLILGLSIALTILMFIALGTLILGSYFSLIETPITLDAQKFALACTIAAILLSIVFALMVYLMIEEIKKFRKIRKIKKEE